jgi:hypothetical protein
MTVLLPAHTREGQEGTWLPPSTPAGKELKRHTLEADPLWDFTPAAPHAPASILALGYSSEQN